MRLTHWYASSPNCSPSRGSLLTGRIPARIGLYDVLSGRPAPGPEPPGLRGNMKLREEELTLAEVLKASGYDTVQLGKWHLDRSSGAPEGEDEDPLGPPREHHRSAARHGFDTADSRRRSATELVQRFIAWNEGRPTPQRPFFAFLSTYEVHEPLSRLVAPEHAAPFSDPDTVARARSLATGGPPRSELTDAGAALYFGALSQVDAALGQLVAHLSERDQLADTLIVFTSDNGPEYRLDHSYGSTGGLRGAKGRVYEGGIRVPAIVSWPAQLEAGRTSSEPVQGVDLMPTLLAAAGAEDPRAGDRDGLDVLPALRGGELPERSLYWGTWAAPGRVQYALRRGRYKVLAGTAPLAAEQRVVEHVKTAPLARFELYDIESDPQEQRDLSTRDPERLDAMARELEARKRSATGDGPDWDLEEVRYKARTAWPKAPYSRWEGGE